MTDRCDRAVRQLRALQSAYRRLLGAIPDAKTARANYDRELQRTLAILEAQPLGGALDKLLPGLHASLRAHPVPFDIAMLGGVEGLIALEARLAQVAKQEIVLLYDDYLSSKPDTGAFIRDTTELSESLTRLSDTAAQMLEELRTQTRTRKKAGKRKLATAVWSAALGTTLIITNVAVPEASVASYALGAHALNQAMRDVLGAPDNN